MQVLMRISILYKYLKVIQVNPWLMWNLRNQKREKLQGTEKIAYYFSLVPIKPHWYHRHWIKGNTAMIKEYFVQISIHIVSFHCFQVMKSTLHTLIGIGWIMFPLTPFCSLQEFKQQTSPTDLRSLIYDWSKEEKDQVAS